MYLRRECCCKCISGCCSTCCIKICAFPTPTCSFFHSRPTKAFHVKAFWTCATVWLLTSSTLSTATSGTFSTQSHCREQVEIHVQVKQLYVFTTTECMKLQDLHLSNWSSCGFPLLEGWPSSGGFSSCCKIVWISAYTSILMNECVILYLALVGSFFPHSDKVASI